MPEPKPTVVILCGGRGTRIQEHSAETPKPLIEIGGRAIVWHVIGMYRAHGFQRFLLLIGYRGEQVRAFVAGESWPSGVVIDCLDTGTDTATGERLLRAAPALAREERFCLAYADGVADIDLAALLAHHRCHGAAATMAVVRPRLPFGVARLGGSGAVLAFSEKPRSALWVNAGFFCFERSALAALEPGSVLEREPLERLAAGGELRAYRHEGFWECMDTYKDWITLNELWDGGRAPWVSELN
ncbi:MAG: NTP transferase domain-containing protein [Solirubrobacterales bacterium]|nr:NTP transferase domain-containing protein [Solirubrobacterales bacterium]